MVSYDACLSKRLGEVDLPCILYFLEQLIQEFSVQFGIILKYSGCYPVEIPLFLGKGARAKCCAIVIQGNRISVLHGILFSLISWLTPEGVNYLL